MSFPLIWVMSGHRRGDSGQVYALAEELGLPFETRNLLYNWRYWLSGRFMGASAISVRRDLREKTLVPPWPDLIILVGKRTVPVARWVKEQSGGRTRLVLLGHPRVHPDVFDLVFTTRQYLTPSAPQVRLLPVAMSRYRQTPRRTEEESGWIESLPRPRWLLMLGGNTRHWRIRPSRIADDAATLADRVASEGGSLIVVRSARTTDAMLDRIEARLEEDAKCEWRVVRHDFPRFPVLLDSADALYPTGDSVSMISESVITGKPVGIVPVELSWRGWLMLGSGRNLQDNPRRDLRRFWNYLHKQGLAGTIEELRSSDVPNPVIEAASEVRALLERCVGKLST